MKHKKFYFVLAFAIVLVAACVLTQPAQAQTYNVLYTFGFKHGAQPEAGLIRDPKGNLYGTTVAAGPNRDGGVVFKLTKAGREKVLYGFPFTRGSVDGSLPYAGVIRDSGGNLYGTTSLGGASGCGRFGWGCGVVFKLDPAGNYTVLHTFTGAVDGSGPGDLIRDSAGNLYGTAGGGGAYGSGVLFKLEPAGNYTVLYSFTGGADGASPASPLLRDAAGNLYGAVSGGGAYGSGVLFKLDPTGSYTILHTFTGGADGAWPVGGLVRDGRGNLYGAASGGGTSVDGCGVIFKLNPKGNFKVLHDFGCEPDGANPSAGLIRDKGGNLYGTTYSGGDPNGSDSCWMVARGCGVVFKLDNTGQFTLLHSFEGPDGSNPRGRLLLDAAGNLFGTTADGRGVYDCDFYDWAYGCGVAFEITP
jgi:uncharacterized repeat protein (TIGR03803 family)